MNKIKYLILIGSLIGGITYAQENARILSSTTTYTLDDNLSAEIEESYKIRINNERGYPYAVFRQYMDKFRKITDVTVDVHDLTGKRVKRIRKSQGMEVGFNPSYEISDGKTLVILPEYKNYPYILEVSVKTRLNGYLSLPTWTPREYFNLAVDNATLKVIRPKSMKINFLAEHISGKSSSSDDKITTTYEVSGLAHVDKKVRYKDFYDAQPKVYVSPERFELDNKEGSFSNWAEFGDWFIQLNSDKYALSKSTMSFIDGLQKDDKEKLLREIYEYMQDRTRYVSIQLGIGGYKSLPTEEVEKFGYGDCKALTTYMKNMLDYAGVESNYILARAGNDVPDVIGKFPSNQFNHVFLGVPVKGDTLFYECTSQTSPANYVGTFTDDRNVLWLASKQSSIIRSRVYDHTVNNKTNKVKIEINEEGDAMAHFETTNTGVFFDEIMLYKGAPSDYVGEYNKRKFEYSDFIIKDFKYSQAERKNPTFNATYLVKVNGLGRLVGDRLVLPLVPVPSVDKYLETDELMKFFSIKRGVTVNDEIEIDLPSGYWAYNLPPAEDVETNYGRYQLSIDFEGNKLKISRTITLYKGDYFGDAYELFKDFYDKIDKIEGRKLVLNPKT